MAKIALSEARVKALVPRKSAYEIRDAKLRGFGVRVLPSGTKRFFIHTQHQGERVWKIVGGADSMSIDEARTRASRPSPKPCSNAMHESGSPERSL